MTLCRYFFLWILLVFSSCSTKENAEEIIQGPGPEESQSAYEPGDVNDIQKDLLVPVTSAISGEFQPGTPIEQSIDGDKSTIYHSRWGGETSFPVTLEYEFEKGTPGIDYAILYPRKDGTNGLITKAVIYIKQQGEATYTEFRQLEMNGTSSPKTVQFPEGFHEPKAVKIVVTEGVNEFVSLAEIEFYQKNPSLEESLEELFETKAATRIKAGVTREAIAEVENDFIKTMALAMIDGHYDSFRTGTYQSYPDPNPISKANKTSPYGMYDNVTGIYVPWGTEMVVFLDDFEGDAALRIVNHSRGFDGEDYVLKPGANRFQVTTEGLAYLIFQNDQQQQVAMNIATGKVNGYYDSSKNSNADWQDLLDKATYSFFDVLGQYSHLTFTTNSFREHTDDIEKLIGLYDDMVAMEQEFIGLYKYHRENKTRMYFRANTHQDMYMFATAYRTEYSESTLSSLANPELLKASPWGPAHEVGHMNQTRPGLSWLGMTEVTTNIYSLYVQKAWENPSRIDTEEVAGYNNYYEKAFTEIIGSKLAHNAHQDVFGKLVPFWQLQLYLADIKGQADFYKDVHEAIRQGQDQATPGESQVEFVKICSDIAQLDLTDFFEQWGFLTPVDMEINDYGSGSFIVTADMVEEARSYIASKSYPKPDAGMHFISDSTMDLYRDGGRLIPGSAAISGNKVSISGASNAVAFQVENASAEIRYISSRPYFKLDNWLPTDIIKAVGHDGSTQLVTIE